MRLVNLLLCLLLMVGCSPQQTPISYENDTLNADGLSVDSPLDINPTQINSAPILLRISSHNGVLYEYTSDSNSISAIDLLCQAADRLDFKLVLDEFNGFTYVEVIDTYAVVSQSNYLWTYALNNSIPLDDITNIELHPGDSLEFVWRDG